MPMAATEAASYGRPAITPELAATLVAQRYGLTGAVTELGSQQDRNFLLRPDTGPSGASAGALVFKVFHPATDAAVVHDQVAAMTALASAGIEAPAPVAAADGTLVQRVALDGADHFAVALRFVEGEQLVDERHLPTHLVTGLASLVARVSRALADVPATADRETQWDLRHAATVVSEFAPAVPEDRRGQLLAVTERAWARVQQVAVDLPVQLIHGDITDDNVVARTVDARPRVVGVIDFGDVVGSWRIGEVAVTLASMLHHDLDDHGVLRAMTATLEQGLAADDGLPLTPAERSALWPLVQLRCAVLVASGWQQLAVDPHNTYATTRMAHEWRSFETAAGLDADAMAALLLPREDADASTTEAPVALLALRGVDGGSPTPLSFAPDGDDAPSRLLLRPDTEALVLHHALARHPLVVVPQREPRVTSARPGVRPDRQRTYPLAAESVSRGGHELVTLADATVLSTGPGTLHVRIGAHRLEVADVQPSPACVPGALVTAGESLGRATPLDQVSTHADGSTTTLEHARHHLRLRLLPASAAIDLPWDCPADLAPGYGALVAGTDAALGLATSGTDHAVDAASEQARRNAFLPDNTERYYARPPVFVRGWRSHLLDADGRAHLDMVNNVAAIGHSHPRLQAAVTRALGRLNTNSRFLYRDLADLSERILETTRGADGTSPYDSVVLVNSGTEAVDLALRMATIATGRRQVVTHAEGYHGWSTAADAITTSAYDNPHALDSRPSWVTVTDVPNAFRGTHRGEGAGAAYAADLNGVLDGLVDAGTAPAAVIMESILGNSGGVVPAAGYSVAMQEAAHRVGALTIADEVQVGYARTGESFWAFQAEGVTPDVVVCAKAMGNGVPLGAVITRKEISDQLGREGTFFSTTGGSPVACAAGLAVLDVLADEGLQANAKAVGDHLAGRVAELAAQHESIAAVHGRGLYRGIELVTDRDSLTPDAALTAAVCEALLARGVIDQATSERQNVLKVKPPLTLTVEEADSYVDALDEVLSRKWF
ncbi:aminotransferase class III-fold pyridoxal phosphate-dependent enzyme [Nocardioides bruguierae]|uniref:Aminotransferase class III-fold pyridoxal phosphate-dependent enzyme n=1 Tax=Nocardioides bruguierae TaxID=2945102 RepID=A0A9X2D5Q6_9ACTN|nr:aminotransferase class III-fold pyridoxal phosphate-dependent enzyme [Nocardioides bruguierae]MCM0619504.1 aminotransferase class III-fold pyridoxal phosphate-dependent enzyme [Nocardioides bruguierae]